MQKINLWLIRHGESTSNAGEWSANPELVGLTATGEIQSERIAKQIIVRPDLLIVSPAKRVQETAKFIIQRWQDVPVEIWPIQEWIYLSPSRYEHMSLEERREAITSYWEKADPFYCDSEDVESFACFIARVQQFQKRLQAKKGFIIVVGHGHFLKAYQLGLQQWLAATSQWMKTFREFEIAQPMQNGEIIQLE